MSRCGWCGAQIGAAAERRPGRVLCGECAAWTTDPAPSGAELERAYGDWYRPADGRFFGLGDAVLRRLRGRLARRLDRIAPPGPVLDVGAGDGALLDALAARGREAVGIERAAVHPAVREVTLDAVDGSFAAVVLWHSLEHLPAAGQAMDRAAGLIAPGGVLVVAIPNPASLQARVFGDSWFGLDLPRHLVHLPSAALLERLRQLGLAVERVSYLRGGQIAFGWLHGWLARLPGHPDLYDAIRRPGARRRAMSGPRRVAILGAAVVLLPLALLFALAEATVRRGGTLYVEARRV